MTDNEPALNGSARDTGGIGGHPRRYYDALGIAKRLAHRAKASAR